MTTPDIERLDAMLTRLKLTAIRERLDTLLDEAARRELTLRETLAYLCEQEVAHKEQRRIQMGLSIARFPFLRTLEGFDFSAQPAVDPGQIRELACGRWIANGDALLLLGPPGVGKKPPRRGTGPGIGQGRLLGAVHHRHGTDHPTGPGPCQWRPGGAAEALRQAQAIDHRRAGLPAAGAGGGQPVLPAGHPALRTRQPTGDQQPSG